MEQERAHSAICLDCGRSFWGWTWDQLYREMDWHEPRHVVHVVDDEFTP